MVSFFHTAAVARAADFVGATSCADCHAEAVEAWRGSHHALAMQKATKSTVLGNFDGAEFVHAGVKTRFFRRDGEYVVRTDGADGRLADFPVSYTFGVYPLQQYLIDTGGGRLQALTIAWDSRPADQGGQKWFHLYPDQSIEYDDPLHWTGLNQNWNYMCAECHSTNLRRNYDADTATYDTTWTEINVACEACHGPGSDHVAWARAGAERGANAEKFGLQVQLGRTTEWSINEDTGMAVNLMSTDSQQVETCARCHSRRVTLSEEYRHGQPLIDTYRLQVLLDTLYFSDGQIQDEVYVYGSFIQSKMYARGVVCTDCHEPHALALRAKGNDLCSTCHLATKFDDPEHHFHQPGSQAAQCVTCHMPARVYMVNDSRRDHSFRVPRPDLSGQTQAPDVCTDCHRGRSSEWAARVIVAKNGEPRTSHFGVAIQSGRSGTLDAERLLIELAEDGTQPSIARATAAVLLGSYLSPVSIPSIALLIQDSDPLIRINALAALEGADPRLRMQLVPALLNDQTSVVRAEAANALADVPAAMFDEGQRMAFGAAVDEYIEVQLNNAERPESWTNLGNLHLRLGNPAKAMTQYQRAIDLDPTYAPAYANLADLHRAQQEDDAAARVLLQGLSIMPEIGSLHHAYGLLLVRGGKLDQALAELARAVELEPGNVRFRYVYAIGLSSTGRLDDAIRELQMAHDIRPVDRQVLVALINFHRDQGDVKAARPYAEKLAKSAAWDKSAQALLQQLSN